MVAMGSFGRLFFTSLFRWEQLSTLFIGTETFNALRCFLLCQQRVVTFRALTRYRSGIDDELAIRITIAGVEGFAVTRPPLDKMSTLALRAANSRFVRLIDQFGVFAGRILTASDKHTEAPLP